MLGFKSLVTVAALCAVCLETSTKWQLVAAQDSDAASDVVVEADPEATEKEADPEAPAEGAELSEEEKIQNHLDQCQDMKDKMAQLMALLEAKGDDAPSGLKEQIAGLQQTIGSICPDGDGSSPGTNKELTEFIQHCLIQTMARLGRTSKNINTLAKLGEEKFTREDAAKTEFWRTAIACVVEATDEDLKDFKEKTKKLPTAFVKKAEGPEGEKRVLDLEEDLWKELKVIAPPLVDAYVNKDGQSALPLQYGLLAFIPLGLLFAFMAKIYYGEQKRKAEEAARKSKKRNSGSSERAATPAKKSGEKTN